MGFRGFWGSRLALYTGNRAWYGVGMPAPLNVDREAVRVLVVALGARPAARQMGIPEDTVLAWSARFGWLEGTKPTQALPKSMQPKTAIGASVAPAEALADAMENLSERSKLGFLKASARVAEHLADENDPEMLLARAKAASGWAKTAALAGGWSNGSGTVQVSVGLRLEMD